MCMKLMRVRVVPVAQLLTAIFSRPESRALAAAKPVFSGLGPRGRVFALT